MTLLRLLLLLLVPAAVMSVDKHKFRTCNDSAFCRRYRTFVKHMRETQHSIFSVEATSVKQIQPGYVRFMLHNSGDDSVNIQVDIKMLQGGVMRYTIDETNGLHTRYRTPQGDVVQADEHLPLDKNMLFQTNANSTTLSGKAKAPVTEEELNYIVIVSHAPFDIEVYANDNLLQLINGEQLMNFERYREKDQKLPPSPRLQALQRDVTAAQQETQAPDAQGAEVQAELLNATVRADTGRNDIVDATSLEQSDLWSDNFGGHYQTQKKGPAAVGVDVAFNYASHVYGLSGHAAPLDLALYGEPYRFWNSDVFEYELNSPMALYGSVPVIYARHENTHTHGDATAHAQYSGHLWVNPSETWVQLSRHKIGTPENSDEHATASWFLSETGVIDAFVLLGPSPKAVLGQVYLVSGLPFMPPLFSMGKHQCRWNYRDEADVREVDAGFDKFDIPYDVIWLDIEHTDGKKYFTWHPSYFPSPKSMLENLAAHKRKCVTIVDPHIKKDEGYDVYRDCRNNDYWTKKENGEAFEGWCWPGSSYYPDFSNPQVRAYFASHYSLDKYQGSTKDLFIWNDMNEPSVFNGPEVGMPRDNLHMGGVEHRELHNLYGMYYMRSTFEGLAQRDTQQRPFLLSRSFFLGAHKYGAIWTGDNMARWDHLAMSLPMLLSHTLGGIGFIGADVGGFFGNPETELLVRWHQTGIWYPFYRAHAHLDAARREPWLFGDEATQRIRDAVTLRYRLLPYWYTLFAYNALRGESIVRPVWFEFPNDRHTSATEVNEKHMMAGSSFLVPVVSDSVGNKPNLDVYLPQGAAQWYLFQGGAIYAPGKHSLPLSMDYSPVFVRGGSIVPTKERRRRSSAAAVADPYTLHIYVERASDGSLSAKGTLFVDDFNSYSYQQGMFVHQAFSFDKGTLTSSALTIPVGGKTVTSQPDASGKLFSNTVERVVLWGLPKAPTSVSFTDAKGAKTELTFTSSALPQPLAGADLSSGAVEGVRVEVKKPPIVLGKHGWQLVVA